MNASHSPKPNSFLLKFFRLFCHPDIAEDIEGDLVERFELRVQNKSISAARWLMIKEILLLMKPNLMRSIGGSRRLNHFGVIKNHFKTAPRTLLKHPLVTSVSLASLIVGISCFQLIYSWINNELKMNQCHQNIGNIHMAVAKSNPMSNYRPNSPSHFFDFNYQDHPELVNKLELRVYSKETIKFIYDHTAHQGVGMIADSSFFDFFDFEVQHADTKSVLKDPNNIVLTSAYARKVFGDLDPMGQIVQVSCDRVGTYQVAGIIEQLPSNSTITFDYLIPTHSQDFWSRMSCELYLASNSADMSALTERLKDITKSHPQYENGKLSFVPFEDIYFDHGVESPLFTKYGEMGDVRTMGIIGVLVLLVSSLSFINLQTVRHLSVIKKVGIKQVNGASKFDLCLEVLVSKFYLLLLVSAISFLTIELLFDQYCWFLELDIDRSRWFDFKVITCTTGAILTISLLISVLQIFRTDAIQAFQNQLKSIKIPYIQRFISTLQYTLTVILIISTIVVFMQFQFMLNQETGLVQSSIISTNFLEEVPRNIPDKEKEKRWLKMEQNYHWINYELKSHPDIIAVSQGYLPMDNQQYLMPWKAEPHKYESINTLIVNPTHADIFGLKMAKGRFFSDSLDQERSNKLVINQAAMKYWNIEDFESVGMFNSNWEGEGRRWQILGVTEDFHYQHLSKAIEPLVMIFMQDPEDKHIIRLRPGKEKQTISEIKELYDEANPQGIFTFSVFENQVKNQYQKEKQLSKIYTLFSVVALLLSSIGLFTFALYESRRRTKEIGIRKVNGASFSDIFKLLNVSFLKTVIIAVLLAWPIAWYFMKNWLDNFAYRTELDWWIFGAAGLSVLALAIIATFWQVVRSARQNPVESLRYE